MIMKKQFLLLVFTICYYTGYSQSNTIAPEEIGVGKNLMTGASLQGSCYKLPGKINAFFIDTAANTGVLQLQMQTKDRKQLKSKGSVVCFNLSTGASLWQLPVNYDRENILLSDDYIIQKSGKYSYSLSPESGMPLWSTTSNLDCLFPSPGVGIGYPGKALTQSDKLTGTDLSGSGKLWERKISRTYGWDEIYPLSDTTLLISSDGLHMLNLKTGEGWDYITTTGNPYFTKNDLLPINSPAPGLFQTPCGIPVAAEQIHNLVSNILVENNKIYLAAAESITCLNMQGKTLWTVNLPENTTGNSSIFIENEHIYLINKGYAYWGYTPARYGTPFVVAYNKNTGEKKYFELQEKAPVLDYTIKNGSLYLLSETKISQLNLSNGALIQKMALTPSTDGILCEFAKHPIYQSGENSYTDVTSDTTKLYITNDQSGLLIMNHNLEKLEQIPANRLYFEYMQKNGLTFIRQNGKTTLLNNNLKPIAQINTGKNFQLHGNLLYCTTLTDLLKIDLNGLLSKD